MVEAKQQQLEVDALNIKDNKKILALLSKDGN